MAIEKHLWEELVLSKSKCIVIKYYKSFIKTWNNILLTVCILT